MGADESEGRIVRYTAEEIDEMLARGEDRTDWERLRSLTDEEVEASIDFDEEGEFDCDTARVSTSPPQPKSKSPSGWIPRSSTSSAGRGPATRPA